MTKSVLQCACFSCSLQEAQIDLRWHPLKRSDFFCPFQDLLMSVSGWIKIPLLITFVVYLASPSYCRLGSEQIPCCCTQRRRRPARAFSFQMVLNCTLCPLRARLIWCKHQFLKGLPWILASHLTSVNRFISVTSVVNTLNALNLSLLTWM